MKTSVYLAPELGEEAKIICSELNWSMTALINAAVQQYLWKYNKEKLQAKQVENQLAEA